MFIYNFKINGTRVFKTFFACIVLLVFCILCVCVYRIFSGASENFVVNDEVEKVSKIDSKNYTNVLKSVCEDIDSYVGKKLSFTGYVYRVNDIPENQFILARNMLISSDTQYVVVGFLCEYSKAKDFPDNSWIEVTGEIQKGSYHGSDMPIVKITNITQTQKPTNEYVNEPDNSYIPTSTTL